MHNLFEGIENIPTPRQSCFFYPGTYKVRIDSVKLIRTRKGDDMVVIETQVVETDNPSRPVGCRPSQLINFKHAAATDNFKGFVAAGLGISDDEDAQEGITSELCTQIVGDTQPFAGLVLGVTATSIKTKKGRDFTVLSWSPSDELMADLAV